MICISSYSLATRKQTLQLVSDFKRLFLVFARVFCPRRPERRWTHAEYRTEAADFSGVAAAPECLDPDPAAGPDLNPFDRHQYRRLPRCDMQLLGDRPPRSNCSGESSCCTRKNLRAQIIKICYIF